MVTLVLWNCNGSDEDIDPENEIIHMTQEGKIYCHDGGGFENAEVTAMDENGNVQTSFSDVDGIYSFDMDPNLEYTIEFDYPNDDPFILDTTLTEMYNYILYARPMSDYNDLNREILDINENGSVTTFDLVLMKKYMLGQGTIPFDRWRFFSRPYDSLNGVIDLFPILPGEALPDVTAAHAADVAGEECAK